MIQKVAAAWRWFVEREPGRRFESMYVEHRVNPRSVLRRVVYTVAGVLVVAIGIVALVAPGPGLLFIAFGAALVALESMRLARALDRFELALRRLWVRIRSRRR